MSGTGAPPDPDQLNAIGRGSLPGLVGLEIVSAGRGAVTGRLPVRDALLAPNGYLHAASVIALLDTLCGYGVRTALPDGAENFTTIELKSNFLGTAREGVLLGEASLAHGGKTTQVWDARACREADGKTVALFRCTQMILYPR